MTPRSADEAADAAGLAAAAPADATAGAATDTPVALADSPPAAPAAETRPPASSPVAPPSLLRRLPLPLYSGGNRVELLRGGDRLFPAMAEAIERARHSVWLATYIYHLNDESPLVRRVTDALAAAAARGVRVQLVIDGFGARGDLADLQQHLGASGVRMAVFRPIRRWWHWFQPALMRRLHQKLCVVDGDIGFVGGINLIEDRFDLVHGWSAAPRLDFAVQVRGPVVPPIEQAVQAVWTRAHLGAELREEVAALARSTEPLARVRRLVRRLRMPRGRGLRDPQSAARPSVAAFVLRDNLRQRRTIERAYVDAIRHARQRVDLVSPYFYPGLGFRRALVQAARRGVRVRLLLQGKLDYRIAGLAASALYDELIGAGVRVFEYTPAFLHAKIACVDDDWATVGSSNIDPLSLLLNLEANAVVRDAAFADKLAQRFDAALAASHEVKAPPLRRGWRRWLSRGFVAWCANLYLRVAGITGRY